MGKKKSTQKADESGAKSEAAPASATVVKAAGSVDQLRQEFDKLVTQFLRMEDPVARYMKREEMHKLQEVLKEKGVNVDVP